MYIVLRSNVDENCPELYITFYFNVTHASYEMEQWTLSCSLILKTTNSSPWQIFGVRTSQADSPFLSITLEPVHPPGRSHVSSRTWTRQSGSAVWMIQQWFGNLDEDTVSEWVIKYNGRVIITYTLESLSSLTQITHNLQVTIKISEGTHYVVLSLKMVTLH